MQPNSNIDPSQQNLNNNQNNSMNQQDNTTPDPMPTRKTISNELLSRPATRVFICVWMIAIVVSVLVDGQSSGLGLIFQAIAFAIAPIVFGIYIIVNRKR